MKIKHFLVTVGIRCFHTTASTRALPPRLAGVFYDWDGTLIEFRAKQFLDSVNAALYKSGYPNIQPALLDSKTFRETFARATQCPIKTEKVLDTFYHHFSTHPLSRHNLMPGVQDLLKRVKDCGLPQGIVSNLDHRILIEEVERLGLSEYFSVVIGSRHDQHPKPNPALLLEALSSAGIAPSRSILYVGDSPGDIIAAREAGCSSVFVGESNTEVLPDIAVTKICEIEIIIEELTTNGETN